MRVREIAIVLPNDRKVKAIYPKEGYGVMVFLEPSSIDKDFEANVWVPSAEELEQIKKALDKSDDLTHKLLGHGWEGKRPFWKLEDFV